MRLTLSVVIVLAFAILARAEGIKWQGQDPMRQACGTDAERFCKGASNPGMCLHEHWDELSQGCRDFKEGMKKQWQEKQQGKQKGEKAQPKKGKMSIRWSDPAKEAGGKPSGEKQRPGAD